MIGELCAVQGQIETLIQRTAKLLLSVSDDVIMAIFGSTSVRVNCDIWIKICRERINDAELLKVVEQAHKSATTISEGRSNFVHAMFESEPWFDIILPFTTTVAIRVKNRNKNEMKKLKEAR